MPNVAEQLKRPTFVIYRPVPSVISGISIYVRISVDTLAFHLFHALLRPSVWLPDHQLIFIAIVSSARFIVHIKNVELECPMPGEQVDVILIPKGAHY